MIVKCTKTRAMEIVIRHQSFYDDYDNIGPGYYAWVGPPDDQSDFVVGPCDSEGDAIECAKRKLRQMGYRLSEVKS